MPEFNPQPYAEALSQSLHEYLVFGVIAKTISHEEAERLIAAGALSFSPEAGPRRIVRVGDEWYAEART